VREQSNKCQRSPAYLSFDEVIDEYEKPDSPQYRTECGRDLDLIGVPLHRDQIASKARKIKVTDFSLPSLANGYHYRVGKEMLLNRHIVSTASHNGTLNNTIEYIKIGVTEKSVYFAGVPILFSRPNVFSLIDLDLSAQESASDAYEEPPGDFGDVEAGF
jgi:hypothetical protein